MNRFVALGLAALLSVPANARVAIPRFGYHPKQEKRFVVYTQADHGTFRVLKKGKTAYEGTLLPLTTDTGERVPCQGGQPCLIGDLSPLKARGVYRIEVDGRKTPAFLIDPNIFIRQEANFVEFFEAMKQQGSEYHSDLHAAQRPPFPMMGDGSYVMTTHMASVALARLAKAYTLDPVLFRRDVHGEAIPDVAEAILTLDDYLAGMQRPDGGMPGGYLYDFGAPLDYDPAMPRYNKEPDPRLRYDPRTTLTNTLDALVAYAESLPIVDAVRGHGAAKELFQRTLATLDRVRAYPAPQGNDAAALGTALFLLHEYTGRASYLREAMDLKERVDFRLDPRETLWNEFYWGEYAKQTKDGSAFIERVLGDWDGGKHPISAAAEHAYIMDLDWDFQHSAFMLNEGLFAAIAMAYSSAPHLQDVADAQLQWLSGMNSVESDGRMISRSFLFGIGENGKNQHTRLVDPLFFERGGEFVNGAKNIRGWVFGAYDSDHDGVLDDEDLFGSYKHRETTIPIVATAMQLMATLDAHYWKRPSLHIPRF